MRHVVYACELFGRCTLEPADVLDIPACSTCPIPQWRNARRIVIAYRYAPGTGLHRMAQFVLDVLMEAQVREVAGVDTPEYDQQSNGGDFIIQVEPLDAVVRWGRAHAALTYWETTRPRIPLAGRDRHRRYAAHSWLASMLSAWGAEHVHYVPPVVDCSLFRPDPHIYRGRRRLRVGISGREWHGRRKRVRDAVRAALDAGCEVTVKLHDDERHLVDVDNVEVVGELDDSGLADWYRSLDVYLHPSRGEGLGLQPLEALACGVPVLYTPWSGHAEFLNPACGWPIRGAVRTAGEFYRGCGHWYEADMEHVTELLRSIKHSDVLERRRACREVAVAYDCSRDDIREAYRHALLPSR